MNEIIEISKELMRECRNAVEEVFSDLKTCQEVISLKDGKITEKTGFSREVQLALIPCVNTLFINANERLYGRLKLYKEYK